MSTKRKYWVSLGGRLEVQKVIGTDTHTGMGRDAETHIELMLYDYNNAKRDLINQAADIYELMDLFLFGTPPEDPFASEEFEDEF